MSDNAPPSQKDSKKGNGSYTGALHGFVCKVKQAVNSKPEAKLPNNIPACVLGRKYEGDNLTEWVNQNVHHILYFSYRDHFSVPLSNEMDFDTGWGCMIRTGQMMLCEALRRTIKGSSSPDKVSLLFRDIPSAPFSIHRMTEVGATKKIPVGHWFNPTGLALTLHDLVAQAAESRDNLEVVIGREGMVKRADITNAFLDGKQALVVLPVMLGMKEVGASYCTALSKCLEMPTTLGIVGGKPNKSYYFVGTQGNQLFYLDPHTVQPAYTTPETIGNVQGVRGTMPTREIDPSMLLCFLLTNRGDFDEWLEQLQRDVFPVSEYPIFSVPEEKRRKSFAAASPKKPPVQVAKLAARDDEDSFDDCDLDAQPEPAKAEPSKPMASSSSFDVVDDFGQGGDSSSPSASDATSPAAAKVHADPVCVKSAPTLGERPPPLPERPRLQKHGGPQSQPNIQKPAEGGLKWEL